MVWAQLPLGTTKEKFDNQITVQTSKFDHWLVKVIILIYKTQYISETTTPPTTRTTTTTATPRKVKNCCPVIRVKNEWEPKGKVYYNVGDINGRQYWATDKNAIWFDGEQARKSFDWMYGRLENLGGKIHNNAKAVSNKKRTCPTEVKDWHYSAVYSNDDQNKIFTKIACVRKL